MTSLDVQVREYLDSGLSVPKELSEAQMRLAQVPSNKEFAWTRIAGGRALQNTSGRFAERIEDEGAWLKAVGVATDRYAGRDSGLLLGTLNPGVDIEGLQGQLPDELYGGLVDGQVYRLKFENGTLHSRDLKRGALGIGAGFLYSFFEMAQAPPDQMALPEGIIAGGLAVMVGTFVYGMHAMKKTRLFDNDENISRELVKEGAFAYHRNPFYFSTTVGMGTASLSMGVAATVATGSLLGIPFALAGAALYAKANNDAAKRDEVILEKSFGQEYRDYKERVPRFIPKLFAGNTK